MRKYIIGAAILPGLIVIYGFYTYHGTQTPSNSFFTASPTSGKAPLTVTFKNMTGGVLDFGDGISVTQPWCAGNSGPNCSPQPTPAIIAQWSAGVTHTYTSPGSYTAKLKSTGIPKVLAQITITVR
jgi:hypothetical protein